MNFIIDLSLNKRREQIYDVILIIIDHYTKYFRQNNYTSTSSQDRLTSFFNYVDIIFDCIDICQSNRVKRSRLHLVCITFVLACFRLFDSSKSSMQTSSHFEKKSFLLEKEVFFQLFNLMKRRRLRTSSLFNIICFSVFIKLLLILTLLFAFILHLVVFNLMIVLILVYFHPFCLVHDHAFCLRLNRRDV